MERETFEVNREMIDVAKQISSKFKHISNKPLFLFIFFNA
jgi:hypothetical protein